MDILWYENGPSHRPPTAPYMLVYHSYDPTPHVKGDTSCSVGLAELHLYAFGERT